MASKLAPGGPASRKPASETSMDHGGSSGCESDENPTRQDGDEVRPSVRLGGDVREFCARYQIEDEVQATILLAGEHFAIVGEPVLRLVDDPDCGEYDIGIHVQAEGRPERVFRQSEALLDSFLESIDPDKQRFINLIYHPTQE